MCSVSARRKNAVIRRKETDPAPDFNPNGRACVTGAGEIERADAMLASMTGALFLNAIAAANPAAAADIAPSSAAMPSVYGAAFILDDAPMRGAAQARPAAFAPARPRLDKTALPLRDALPMIERAGFRLELSPIGGDSGGVSAYGPAAGVRKDIRRMGHNKTFYPKAAPVVIGFRVAY